MTMTNYGNKYKFQAIMKRRSNPQMVTVQFIKKDGNWGKPRDIQRVTCMTDEEFVEYLAEINHTKVRLVK